VIAFLIRWAVTTVAVFAAEKLIPGIHCSSAGALLGASLLLGIINAFVRPVLLLLSIPFIIVTMGLFIVVVNAAHIRVTGNKAEGKRYFRHSGYPGGISETSFGKMQSRFPGRALEKAVKGMLPKGPLGYAMIKKMKVYAEGTHPHTAQQPKALEI
jgi:uncharacterized membrane protein YvlD (DUF360 family)